MKVYVRLEVFESERAWVHLLKLLDLFLDGRHVWDLSELEAIEQSRWLQHDPNSPYTQHSMYVMKLAINSVYQSTDDFSSTITVGLIGDHNTIVVNDAYRVLSLPAYVIVENAESDGAFISAVSAAYQRGNISTAIEKRWLRFVHAGGSGEIPKRLSELLDEQCPSNRILVLTDNDRKAPNRDEGPTLKKIRTECAKHNVQVCVLQKREIENYIPIRLLTLRAQGSRKYKSVFQAFLQLNQIQRDFYDMKSGFNYDKMTGRATLGPNEEALYPRDKLPRNVIEDLRGGFGEDVWRCFLVRKIGNQDILQQDFESLYFDQPSQMGEIDDLLKRIERML